MVDYPPEECESFAALMRDNGIDPIFLLAPTSTDARIEAVGKVASGYVYYVSLKGVTGSATLDLDSVAARMPLIKKHVNLPVGVGFGIRDAQTARAIGSVADAVVIGSRLVQLLEDAPRGQAVESLRASLPGFARRWMPEVMDGLLHGGPKVPKPARRARSASAEPCRRGKLTG